jgi:hypothetical protein
MGETETNFQTFWNEGCCLPTDDPRYEIYRRWVTTKGMSLGDLCYIDFLCRLLKSGDAIVPSKKPRPKRPQSLDNFPLDNFMDAEGEAVCNFVVNHVLRELKTFFRRPELADLFNWPADFIDLLVKQGMRRFSLLRFEAEEQTCRDAIDQKRKEQQAIEQEMKAIEQELIAGTLNHTIYTLRRKYCPAVPRKRGRQPDPWGAFILLAILEHISEKAGQKPGKAEYDEALIVMRKARGKNSTSTPRQSEQNAYKRIEKLKEAHRRSWRSDLRSLKKKAFLLLA